MNKTYRISLSLALGALLAAPWYSPSGSAKADDETRTKTTIHEHRVGDDMDLDDGSATVTRTKKKIVKKTHGDDDDDTTVVRKKSKTTTTHESDD
jgi:hypothetical protein